MRMTRDIQVFPTAIALLVLAPYYAAGQDEGNGEKSIQDGVYTVEQARRGEKINQEVCAACHIDEWFSETLMMSWAGAPVSALYEVVSTLMPEDRPGGLEPQQYADILAYMFELNGVPPGQEELSASKEALDKIIIERRE